MCRGLVCSVIVVFPDHTHFFRDSTVIIKVIKVIKRIVVCLQILLYVSKGEQPSYK